MKAYEQCTRFNRCAVNKCPLDPNYKQMLSHQLDAERKCTSPRKKRVEIGARFDNLAYGGLTGNEYTALAKHDNLPLNLVNAVKPTPNTETHIESGVQV